VANGTAVRWAHPEVEALVERLGRGLVVLTPIARSEARLVERLVGTAYVALDLVALALLLLLLWLTWRLRGEASGKVWAGVLFGFVLRRAVLVRASCLK
jgi:hypothetical protein